MAPEEVALRLAADSGVVVQTGPSFQGDPWDVRLSLASITEEQAGQIAAAFVTLVDRLAEEMIPASRGLARLPARPMTVQSAETPSRSGTRARVRRRRRAAARTG